VFDQSVLLEASGEDPEYEVADVQKLISAGQLELVDTFVTDRAFEEFCRKYGSTVNMALIDRSTRKLFGYRVRRSRLRRRQQCTSRAEARTRNQGM
jgi:hypothetical protein